MTYRAIEIDAFATMDAARSTDLLVAAAQNPSAILALRALLTLPDLDLDAEHAEFGVSPLWAAYEHDNIAAAQALVKAGASVDVREFEDGEWLKDLAIQEGRTLWVELLSQDDERTGIVR